MSDTTKKWYVLRAVGGKEKKVKELIENEYKKYKDFVKKSSVSDEENVSNMLVQIEGLARAAGVNLVDIKPQASRQVDFYREDAVEVKIGLLTPPVRSST